MNVFQPKHRTETPRYSIPEAARYVLMSPSTLGTWVSGRSYPVKSGERQWKGIIRRPKPNDPRLSYSNLIEAHVLKALRKTHGVPMSDIRKALEVAETKLGVPRVLLSPNLRATKGNLFFEHLDGLINLGKGGQEAMMEVLRAYLRRVSWNKDDEAPAEYFPWTRTEDTVLDSQNYVSILPDVAFGRPIVRSKAITTSIISERFNAGDSFALLAEDYEIEIVEVEEAIRYERIPESIAA